MRHRPHRRRRPPISEARGFGTMAQRIAATEFAGARLRLRGMIRTHAVDWAEAAVLLDVAAEAVAMSFGLLLVGGGAADLTDLSLDRVGTSVPVTRSDQERDLPLAPRNLDFTA